MTAGLNPNETSRAMACQLWMHAPNPMVTLFKTLDVTNLVRVSRKQNLKFNMQMDGVHPAGSSRTPTPTTLCHIKLYDLYWIWAKPPLCKGRWPSAARSEGLLCQSHLISIAIG